MCRLKQWQSEAIFVSINENKMTGSNWNLKIGNNSVTSAMLLSIILSFRYLDTIPELAPLSVLNRKYATIKGDSNLWLAIHNGKSVLAFGRRWKVYKSTVKDPGTRMTMIVIYFVETNAEFLVRIKEMSPQEFGSWPINPL